jgi:hypothetical protein
MITNSPVRQFIPRGCGEARIAGQAYLRSLRQKREEDEDFGDPADFFMICPPFEVELTELGISTQGMTVLPDPNEAGLYHVWDVVGSSYTPADFIEEDKQDGTSRLVPTPQVSQLDLLTPGKSRHFFIAKASLVDAKPVYDRLDDTRIKMCPAGHEAHNEPNGGDIFQMCTSFLWETTDTLPKKNKRLHRIFMPRWMSKKDDQYLWMYWANGWYKQWDELEWVWAAFYWKPIDHVEIVKDNTSEQKHKDVIQLAMELGNGLPFILVDDETGEAEEIT